MATPVMPELDMPPTLEQVHRSLAQVCRWCGGPTPAGDPYCGVDCRDEDRDARLEDVPGAWAYRTAPRGGGHA